MDNKCKHWRKVANLDLSYLEKWPLERFNQIRLWVNFFQWIEYNPISILYKFQINIYSNSREIKYQNIGRTQTDTQTDRHTDRQTGWKQYLWGNYILLRSRHSLASYRCWRTRDTDGHADRPTNNTPQQNYMQLYNLKFSLRKKRSQHYKVRNGTATL